jgi:hypothetical protein
VPEIRRDIFERIGNDRILAGKLLFETKQGLIITSLAQSGDRPGGRRESHLAIL